MRFSTFLAVAAFAAAASASLAPSFVDWGKGPAQWLMTKDEQAQWKKISDDAAAQSFIDLFWARRDPSPGTPANEMKDDFDARVAYADKSFAQGKTRGSMTDRGHVLILLGAPAHIGRTSVEPKSTILTPQDSRNTGEGGLGGADKQLESVQSYSPKQLWTYEAAKTKVQLLSQTAEIAFIDQYGSNEWKLERTGKTDVVGLFNRAIDSFIVQKDLTVAPKYGATAPVATAAAPAPLLAAPAPMKSASFQSAIDDFRGGKSSYKDLYFSYGEFITPQGDYFVPVEVYAPKSAAFASAQELTFFGRIEDETGKVVSDFEEPAKFQISKGDVFVDRVLPIAAGKYKGAFGLAADGKVLSMVSAEMNLTPLDRDAASMSRLILSNNVYALPTAQKPTDAFTFGGLKIVPKADRVFRPNEELWYFVEARNPGLDATTRQPKLRESASVTGTTSKGEKVHRALPMYDADAQPLNGVPGHFGVGTSIPLESFQPGDYVITVKLVDAVSGKMFDFNEPFQIRSEK